MPQPPRTLIVTPTYNEKENLPRFVEEVRQAAPSAHILVVDDNSPDGTGAVADAIAAKDPFVRVMHRAGKLGLGTAYTEAFAQGLEEGFDRFFEMDADLSHDVKYLPSFVAALDGGADVVIGSRNIPGGGVEGWGLGRHVISKGGSLYSRTILGLDVKDLTSGYKAFTRRALQAIDLPSVRSTTAPTWSSARATSRAAAWRDGAWGVTSSRRGARSTRAPSSASA